MKLGDVRVDRTNATVIQHIPFADDVQVGDRIEVTVGPFNFTYIDGEDDDGEATYVTQEVVMVRTPRGRLKTVALIYIKLDEIVV